MRCFLHCLFRKGVVFFSIVYRAYDDARGIGNFLYILKKVYTKDMFVLMEIITGEKGKYLFSVEYNIYGKNIYFMCSNVKRGLQHEERARLWKKSLKNILIRKGGSR